MNGHERYFEYTGDLDALLDECNAKITPSAPLHVRTVVDHQSKEGAMQEIEADGRFNAFRWGPAEYRTLMQCDHGKLFVIRNKKQAPAT